MNIEALITELIDYSIANELIEDADRIYCTNRLLELFGLTDFSGEANSTSKAIRPVSEILGDMVSYAEAEGILTDATTTTRDLFDTKIMGLVTPPPSVVRKHFDELYKSSPKLATDWYYSFSRATNYIRTDRIARDEKWVSPTEYGDLDITINLSKPEKDPRDIAAAGKAKKSGYPACLLCKENEGYAGHITHPARQNHRIIPLKLSGEQYYLQYSPYVYYNEHCIIFNSEHTPMKIDRSTFGKLLSFLDVFPHYTIGSNADLPIVGGSILSHDHFQGGCYEFPMVRAPYESFFEIGGYDDVTAGVIKWPLTTLRLRSKNPDSLADAADKVLKNWRSYTDEDAFIFSETDGVPHNTITPIARFRDEQYELDLVLRNNITTDEHKLGVYHPHSEYHHIKKENIGLIEVMGLAVLPARLKTEMSLLEDRLTAAKAEGRSAEEVESLLSADEKLSSHSHWAGEIYERILSSEEAVHDIIRQEIGIVFSHVLENAGVYKCTSDGRKKLQRFIETLR